MLETGFSNQIYMYINVQINKSYFYEDYILTIIMKNNLTFIKVIRQKYDQLFMNTINIIYLEFR